MLSTIATSLDLEHSSLPESSSRPVHLNDPVSVEWLEKTEDEHVYMSVSIDGTVYSVSLELHSTEHKLTINPGWRYRFS